MVYHKELKTLVPVQIVIKPSANSQASDMSQLNTRNNDISMQRDGNEDNQSQHEINILTVDISFYHLDLSPKGKNSLFCRKRYAY